MLCLCSTQCRRTRRSRHNSFLPAVNVVTLPGRSFVFVMGDFNSCTLDTALPSFHQYVHMPTRNNKTIDLCYGNIPSAYSARAHPPLGRADHSQYHQHHPSVSTTVEESHADQGQGSTMSMDSGCHLIP